MTTPRSADECVARVLNIVGARPLALDALLRVAAVEWSDEVTTACIECADRPRLLLNPAFVERHCHSPERLAALLLHELAHVSMGHTRMFPRPTPAHNVACDAIINREIAAMATEHHADVSGLTALFVEYYEANASPWFLLRPPPGWPLAPDWEASKGLPAALRTVHFRLYRTDKTQQRHTVQYSEIVDALQCAGDLDMSKLLGAHGETAVECSALTSGRDAVAADVLASALHPISGRLAGVGGSDMAMQVQRAQKRAELERALRVLLRRCFTSGEERGHVSWVEWPTRTALPHQDRRAPARAALARALGAPPPLFFADTVRHARPEPTHATIYLDTSGSMEGVLPALHATLAALRRELRPRILLFSTAVAEVDGADFDAGRLRTTGGTSIAPVLEHALQHALQHAAQRVASNTHIPPRALVLTDGLFDQPPKALCRKVKDRGIELHLGVTASGPLHDDKPWVASATRLPI